MDRNRTVAGLDVHKDSIYLCIMGHDEAIIFEKTYGVLTPLRPSAMRINLSNTSNNSDYSQIQILEAAFAH